MAPTGDLQQPLLEATCTHQCFGNVSGHVKAVLTHEFPECAGNDGDEIVNPAWLLGVEVGPKVLLGSFLPPVTMVSNGQGQDSSQQNSKGNCVMFDCPVSCPASYRNADPESLMKQQPSESRAATDALTNAEDTKMTVLEATYTAINWLMNNGLYSVPFVFASIGFSASGIIILIGMACTITAILFGDVFDELRASGNARPTYMDSVQAAFGKRLAGFCSIVCYAELLVYVVNQVIFFALTVKGMLPWLSFEWLVAATCLISVFLSGLSDRAFAYTSLLSAFSTCASCVAVLVSGWEMPDWAEASEVTGSVQDYPSAFSLVLFGAATHPLLPSLYEGTKSKHDYQRVVCSAWMLWGLFAIVWAGAIYYMFGDAVQPVVLCNIARDTGLKRIDSLRWLGTSQDAFLCVKSLLCASLFARPLVKYIAELLERPLPQGNGGMLSVFISFPVFFLLAVFARDLEHKVTWLESASGSVLMSLNALVIPSLSYLLVCRSAPVYRQVAAGCLGALGVGLVMFSGFFPKLE